jgi:hypothetical protein
MGFSFQIGRHQAQVWRPGSALDRKIEAGSSPANLSKLYYCYDFFRVNQILPEWLAGSARAVDNLFNFLNIS